MMDKAIHDLLSQLEIRPVLLDIGASGSTPEIWEGIARDSVYVGFDPDQRQIQDIHEGRFYHSTIINEAVTSDTGDEVTFYLTASPSCSSALKPDHASLSNYLFSDLFTVEREVRVRATSLDSVIDRLSLPGIDWFKTDSQGTDLRLFNSLRPEIRSRVLAVDIEPGLIDAYVGEDMFAEAHRALTESGFWLSSLNVCGAVRMRRSTLQVATALDSRIDDAFVCHTVRQSPGWCEARYLRTIDWLTLRESSPRDYVLSWVFAVLDEQPGFALDLGIEYERVFGQGDVTALLQREPVLLMKRASRNPWLLASRFLSRLERRLRRTWRSGLSR